MEKIPQVPDDHERLEKVEFPNRGTFKEYNPKNEQKSLRSFFKNHFDSDIYPDSRNQVDRVMDFVSSVRDYYESGNQEMYSFGHDDKGTLYAVLSDEENPQKAIMVRMNPFDGKNSCEVSRSSSPVIYASDKHSIPNWQSSVAKVQFSDELGNSTIFTLTNGGKGNRVVEVGSNGQVSNVSRIQDSHMLDYELSYDLGISNNYKVESDNNVRQSIEDFKNRHKIQKEVAKQSIRASLPVNDNEELQLS